MGEYTEVVIKVRIKCDISKDVRDILTHMFDTKIEFDEEYIKSILPEHLKNYDDEIDKFFDWLNPYIEGIPGQCIGYKWHEYDDAPTLVYLKKNIIGEDIDVKIAD